MNHTILKLVFGCVTAALSVGYAQTPVLTVRWAEQKIYQPVYVAIENGYFAKYGIQLKLVGPFTGGPQAVQAAAANQVDAGHSAITGLVTAAAQGFNVIGVADSQTEFKNEPLMQWFVKKDSNIKSLRDLKGKTIGVNGFSGSFYFTMLRGLESVGLKKSDVRFVNIPHPNQGQALLTNQIDVAGVIDPYSAQLEESGQVRPLVTGFDILGENQFSVIFFSQDFMKKNPVAALRFVKAYQQAIKFIQTHPQESKAIMAKYIGVEAKYNGNHQYTAKAAVRMNDVQFWIDALEQEGIVPKGAVKPGDIASTIYTK